MGGDLSEFLPNLNSVYLTNNMIQDYCDIDPLQGCKKLEYVSFMGNPVANKKHYRSYVIFKLPQVIPRSIQKGVDRTKIKDYREIFIRVDQFGGLTFHIS